MNQLNTNAIDALLTKRIMRRVYGLWFWKSVAPLLVVEVLLLAGVALGVLTQISIRHILLNALSASADFRAFIMFFVKNFFVKSIQSRLLLIAYGAMLGFFARDLRQALRRMGRAKSADLLASVVASGNRR